MAYSDMDKASHVARHDGHVFEFPRLVLWVSALFLGALVLDAPLRYGLALLHLDLFVYLPKVLLLLAILLFPFLRGRVSPAFVFVAGLLAMSLAWGVANLGNTAQPLFGIWVLVPLLFGLLVGAVVDITQWRRLWVVLFVVVAIGVFLDPVIEYPWTGQSLDLMGREIEVSRQWHAFGVERYSGFARASFNAASQLLVFALLLVFSLKRTLIKAFVWLVAGLGIALTTTKGVFGGWLILTVYLAGGWWLGWPRYWASLWLFVLAAVLLSMIVLPLSTLLIHYDPTFDSYVTKFFFASFGERLIWMWPDSLRLLDHGHFLQWWLGRGLGGIGMPQQYFEPERYLAADNFFVYIAVDLGIPVAIALIAMLWWRFARSALFQQGRSYKLPVMVALMAHGVVTNLLEDAMYGLVLGFALSSGALPVKRFVVETRHRQVVQK